MGVPIVSAATSVLSSSGNDGMNFGTPRVHTHSQSLNAVIHETMAFPIIAEKKCIPEDEFLLIYLKTIWTEWCVYMVHSQTVYILRLLHQHYLRSLKKLRIQNHLFAIGNNSYCRIERFAAYCWLGRRWLMWVDLATHRMDCELLDCCLWSSLLK